SVSSSLRSSSSATQREPRFEGNSARRGRSRFGKRPEERRVLSGRKADGKRSAQRGRGRSAGVEPPLPAGAPPRAAAAAPSAPRRRGRPRRARAPPRRAPTHKRLPPPRTRGLGPLGELLLEPPVQLDPLGPVFPGPRGQLPPPPPEIAGVERPAVVLGQHQLGV